MWVCGYNGHNQLGLPNVPVQRTLTRVSTLPESTQILKLATNGFKTRLILSNNTVWRSGNPASPTPNIAPTDVSLLDIFIGEGRLFRYYNSGKLVAAGENEVGQLGLPKPDFVSSMTTVFNAGISPGNAATSLPLFSCYQQALTELLRAGEEAQAIFSPKLNCAEISIAMRNMETAALMTCDDNSKTYCNIYWLLGFYIVTTHIHEFAPSSLLPHAMTIVSQPIMSAKQYFAARAGRFYPPLLQSLYEQLARASLSHSTILLYLQHICWLKVAYYTKNEFYPYLAEGRECVKTLENLLILKLVCWDILPEGQQPIILSGLPSIILHPKSVAVTPVVTMDNLQTLPDEIMLTYLLKYLSPSDLASLQATNSVWYQTVQSYLKFQHRRTIQTRTNLILTPNPLLIREIPLQVENLATLEMILEKISTYLLPEEKPKLELIRMMIASAFRNGVSLVFLYEILQKLHTTARESGNLVASQKLPILPLLQ